MMVVMVMNVDYGDDDSNDDDGGGDNDECR